MTVPAAPRRRWFRYSLRTFFVVLTIFCVWLGVQVKWIRDRHDFLLKHEAVRAQLLRVRDAPKVASGHEVAPGWLWLLGEKGTSAIVVYMRLGEFGGQPGEGEAREKEVEAARQLFPEAMTISSSEATESEFRRAEPRPTH